LLNHHFECLGSPLTLFEGHSIDMMLVDTVEAEDWYLFYSKRFEFNVTHSLLIKKYDILFLPTDNHHGPITSYFLNQYKKVYNQDFPGKIISINHTRGICRNPIGESMFIHGTTDIEPYFSMCWDYISPIEKQKRLSEKVSIVLLGDMARREPDYFSKFKTRFENFDELEVYIVNRFPPNYAYTSNCTVIVNASVKTMFDILTKSHYIYHGGYDTEQSTGSYPLAFTTLCKFISNQCILTQYGDKSSLCITNVKLILDRLTLSELQLIENEKQNMIKKNLLNINNE
jgi:hypothetical protein